MTTIDFDANVRDIVSRTTDPDALAECRMFACGTCAHMGPDHRWTDPFDCLVTGCACPGIPNIPDDDIDARWDRAAEEVIR